MTLQPLSSLHAEATEDRCRSHAGTVPLTEVCVEADKHVVASAATRFAVALQTGMPAPRARPWRS
jgi:hypothetical protein